MAKRWYVLPLNPEQWRIGPVSAGRRKGGGYYSPKIGQDQQLFAFQSAVKNAIGKDELLEVGDIELTFFFWREQATYAGTNEKQIQKHQVDATNMQKATEDALQGILMHNDNQVREIRTVIMEQGPNVQPMIVLSIDMWSGPNVDEIPGYVWKKMVEADKPRVIDNSWGGPD